MDLLFLNPTIIEDKMLNQNLSLEEHIEINIGEWALWRNTVAATITFKMHGQSSYIRGQI